MTRHVTSVPPGRVMRPHEHTPPADQMEEDEERFRLYRLCPCEACGGTGKIAPSNKLAGHINVINSYGRSSSARCPACRGEGRSLDLVATCGTPEAVGVALVTLGREGEWAECPVGVLDTQGLKNQKWVLSPWLPSARNLSDAGRQLAHARHQG